jgi:Tfp pilus assembly protein PilO
MTAFLDRWDLRPQERRLVVVFAAVLFVMVNLWFVWPRFKDWKLLKDKIDHTQTTLRRYTNEIARLPDYKKRLSALEKEGSTVLPSAQSVEMVRAVQRLALTNHVKIDYLGQPTKSIGPNTNSFFEELSLPIKVLTGEPSLVDFLYELGKGDSMIRVRDLLLSPGPSGTNLSGQITLVASYQKANVTKASLASTPPSQAPPKLAAAIPAKSLTNIMSKGVTNKPATPLKKPSTNTAAKASTNKTVEIPSRTIKKQ